MRNEPKTEKIGQRMKPTWPGLPQWSDHTPVSFWQGVSHGRVPAEPKFTPIRKRPILRALRHSKDYLNT
ncbi:hypothetical protein F383_34913 [Gossypium arboreum]|uniref:Uncharacterized protein n=1 Tax=Gossypium arboreum TaxID=29729 RepID=A0A0B0N7W0_GOSAR|nr:hypothetical protein F383_34913 [Gossypium arboreum]